MKIDFALELRLAGLPKPETEYRFARPRRWAFDYAWPYHMVALEVEGGMFGKGRRCPTCKRRPPAGHSSVERLVTDMEKYTAAAMMGWAVLRVTPEQASSGVAVRLLREIIGEDDTYIPVDADTIERLFPVKPRKARRKKGGGTRANDATQPGDAPAKIRAGRRKAAKAKHVPSIT